jgi:hypothetical protein
MFKLFDGNAAAVLTCEMEMCGWLSINVINEPALRGRDNAEVIRPLTVEVLK